MSLCFFPFCSVPLFVYLHLTPKERLGMFIMLTAHRKNTWEQVSNRYFAIFGCINFSQEFSIEHDCWINKSIILEQREVCRKKCKLFSLKWKIAVFKTSCPSKKIEIIKKPLKISLRSASPLCIKNLKHKAFMSWIFSLLRQSKGSDVGLWCIWFISNKIDSPVSYIWCILHSEYVTV